MAAGRVIAAPLVPTGIRRRNVDEFAIIPAPAQAQVRIECREALRDLYKLALRVDKQMACTARPEDRDPSAVLYMGWRDLIHQAISTRSCSAFQTEIL